MLWISKLLEFSIFNALILFSDCEQLDIQLPVPDKMKCYVPPHCTAIYCCVDIPLIGRSISAAVDVDACDYSVAISFEKHKETITLLDYKWGTWRKLDLKGVFVIE